MTKTVLSIGGSILMPGEIDVSYLRRIGDMLNRNHNPSDNELAVVTGGGGLARKYIESASEFEVNEGFLDVFGIDASRLNARLLSCAIGGKATFHPPTSLKQAYLENEKGNLVVMGGLQPGQSTDAVSALVAEYLDADLFINATDVKGIYDKNPEENDDAAFLETISIQDLQELVSKEKMGAGQYALVDPLALKVIERSGLDSIFLDGRNLENLESALEGNDFEGTSLTF